MPRGHFGVNKRNEKLSEKIYYLKISNWLKNYLQSTMQNFGEYLVDTDVCATVDLSQGLKRLLKRNNIKSEKLHRKADLTRGLKVDIVVLAYDTVKSEGEIIICEVKRKRGLSLHDCSQLVGYCICSDVRFGLLINVDGGISDALREILGQNKTLTNIIQLINGRQMHRRIGIVSWESKTRRGAFLPNGYLTNFLKISEEISKVR